MYKANYRIVNNKKYIINIEVNDDLLNIYYCIELSEEVYNYLNKNIKIADFNNFSTTRYYVTTDKNIVETVDEVLYDKGEVDYSDEANLNVLKYSFSKTILATFLPQYFMEILFNFYKVFSANQTLLANNYFITQKNKDENIENIIENENEEITNAFIEYSTNIEKCNELMENLKQFKIDYSKLFNAKTKEEVEETSEKIYTYMNLKSTE